MVQRMAFSLMRNDLVNNISYSSVCTSSFYAFDGVTLPKYPSSLPNQKLAKVLITIGAQQVVLAEIGQLLL